MDTIIRKGKKMFLGNIVFPHGIARSGFFNKRESEELNDYGYAFESLLNGTLEPENEEEIAFIQAITTASESSLYAVKLWRKYTDSVNRCKRHHGFLRSESKANPLPFVAPEEVAVELND